MKTFLGLITLLTLSHSISSECCPEVPIVKNAINFAHMFKERADADFNFFDISTEVKLVAQNVIDSTDASNSTGFDIHHIIYEVAYSTEPKRTWFYLIEAYFNTNGSLNKINKFAKIRRKEGVSQTDILSVVAEFFNLTAGVDAATNTAYYFTDPSTEIPGCSLTKMEYVNFYYMYINYFKKGRGLEMDCS